MAPTMLATSEVASSDIGTKTVYSIAIPGIGYPLGRLLLKGAIRDGQTVVVDAEGESGDLTFRPEAAEASMKA